MDKASLQRARRTLMQINRRRNATRSKTAGKKKPGPRSKDRRPGSFDAPSIRGAIYLKLSEICLKPDWVLLAILVICEVRSTP
jgi:hypothetical protein